MADELTELAKARAALEAAGADRLAARVALDRATTRLGTLHRQGAASAARRATERAVARAQQEETAVRGREIELAATIERLRERVRTPRRPEDDVAQLDGQVPVALFPVRLETRFSDGGTTLRIRVYPEQVHVDAHEPGLTDGEAAAARAYWAARETAPDDAGRSAAWEALTRRVRPTRARYLVDATDPAGGGEAPARPGPFTRQPTARLLPERWVAIGLRGRAEVFRVWGSPVTEGLPVGLPPEPDDPSTTEDAAASAPAPTPDTQETLPLDPSIDWLVDYDAARAAGMAVTVTDADVTGGRLADGLDELMVLGVDWGADPQAAASTLTEVMRHHRYSDGLALLGAGVPTNTTEEDRAARGTDPLLDAAALDPVVVRTAPDAAARAGAALGIATADALDPVPAQGSLDDVTAGDMNNALWASTLGAFLDDLMEPLIASATVDEVHEHHRRWVRGRGPLPALRVGRQPYGVLPVLAGRVATGDAFLDALVARLDGMRPFWASATGAVPRLGDSDRPDADVLALLRRTPRSRSFRFHEAFAGSLTSGLDLLAPTATLQELLARITLALAGLGGVPRISGVTIQPTPRAVPVPLVDFGELSETDRLDPDYVTAVLDATRVTGGFRQLLLDPSAASTLLEALLRQSAAQEYVIGSTLLTLDLELTQGTLVALPEHRRVPHRELFGVEAVRHVRDDDEPVSLVTQVDGPVALADTILRAVSGGRTLANHLAVQPDELLLRTVPTRRFAEFRRSLGRLAGLPTAELDRLAADSLDTVSHRLDAWYTSAATRRLDALRQDRPTGTYVGGYGYVEDLRPRGAPSSQGFLHAPSIAHATTAAVLRSGHLARGENAEGTSAVDLGSSRVHRALDLVDGVRRGQPIGALLGYRFERSVRELRLTLARYILPIRQRTPLAVVATGQAAAATTGPVEAVEARDVVDGVRLLDAWRADRDVYYGSLSVAVPPADRAALDGLLEQLDDALDAVSDLLVAESVHQTVLGNAERSAAALDALDRQQPIPDLGVARTPRTATTHGHRVLVALATADPATGWSGLDDARRAAEPRVDAWCGAVLGPPDRFRFAAQVRDAAGTVVQDVAVALPELGLSALATVLACTTSTAGAASELERRVLVRVAAQVTAPDAAEVELRDGPPAGSGVTAVGLRDLLELGADVAALLSGSRQADARSLLPDTERPGSGLDVAELRGRADDVVAALDGAVDALEALDAGSAPDDVVAALLQAGALLPAAVPGAEDPADQAARVGGGARRLLDDLVVREAAFDRTAAEDAAVVAHDLARVRAVLGEDFPVVARFSLPGPAPDGEDWRASIAASLADPDLLAGTSLAVASWATQHALVRPALARLTRCLEGSELLGGRTGPADLVVAQLPRRPGSRWIGLPFDTPPPPATSLVLHALGTLDPAAPFAALVVDQWSDTVPSTQETTGVTFHYDAPGARAPQSVLLAVPGDRAATAWSVEALSGVVREAVDLARIRALDIDDVDTAARFLPAAYLPFNLESKVPSVNLSAIIAAAVTRLDTIFLEEDS